MTENIEATYALLFDKNHNIAYEALQKLQKASESGNTV